jgi:hypothetical protein
MKTGTRTKTPLTAAYPAPVSPAPKRSFKPFEQFD